MFMFRHCVYRRACILFSSYNHVHKEKEKKSSEKKSLSSHEQVCLIRLRFERYSSYH